MRLKERLISAPMSPCKLWLYRLMTGWLPETRCFGLKAALLKWCGARVGRNVQVLSSAIISGDGTLIVGDDVWIGRDVVMTPGRTIQDGSIIAAGCILCKDFPKYAIVGGNPAKLIRFRNMVRNEP